MPQVQGSSKACSLPTNTGPLSKWGGGKILYLLRGPCVGRPKALKEKGDPDLYCTPTTLGTMSLNGG